MKKQTTLAKRALIAAGLVIMLIATCLYPPSLTPATANATSANPASANGISIAITLEGFSGTCPTLTEGADFTKGQPVKADPRYYLDDQGNALFASYIEEKEAQGYTLVWKDESGARFDWFTTPITQSMTVNGVFEQGLYQVRVVYNDGAQTADLVVDASLGQSFVQAHGQEPAVPVKAGYTFTSWIDSSTGQPFDFNAPITSSTTVYAAYDITDPSATQTFDPNRDIAKTLTGTCFIGKTWSIHPAYFSVSNFSGELAGCAGTGTCSLPGALAASYTTATYTATLKSVDVKKGEVTYDVHIVPPNAGNPNGPFVSWGPAGYQTVDISLTVKKNFGGYIEVSKTSTNTTISENNSCYTLEGAVFGIYDKANKRVDSITTDANGYAKSKLLPVGTYTLKEESAPEGYFGNYEQSVTVQPGETTTAHVGNIPISDRIMVAVYKHDRELDKNEALGAATLQGAHFKICYYDGYYDTAEQARQSGDPTRTWTIATDEFGMAYLSETCLVSGDDFYRNDEGAIVLPLGTVTIEETVAPKGYLPTPDIYSRTITGDGSSATVDVYNPPTYTDQVIRGDLAFTKVAGDAMTRLGNVPFKITSQTTGESHILYTDENGMANTSSDWAEHTHNTNAGTSHTDGIWFGTSVDGSVAAPDNALGALPYDTYTIEELPCKTNEMYELVSFEVTISRDKTLLDIGTVDNKLLDQPLNIEGSIDKRQAAINPDTGLLTYLVDYQSTSTTWLSTFDMVDTLECATQGKAYLESLITPVVFGDRDRRMNVWYQTNTKPDWTLWQEGVSTLEATTLDVANLDLEPDEFVSAVRFEHGEVEAGFASHDQGAQQWARDNRYDEADFYGSDETIHDVTFTAENTSSTSNVGEGVDASGSTPNAGEYTYAPARFILYAPEEVLLEDAPTFENSANISLTRELENGETLTDEDQDRVVQTLAQPTAPEEASFDKTGFDFLAFFPWMMGGLGLACLATVAACVGTWLRSPHGTFGKRHLR